MSHHHPDARSFVRASVAVFSSVAIYTAPALAQTAPVLSAEQRADALKRLDTLEKELTELRRQLSSAPIPAPSAAAENIAVCNMANVDDLNGANLDPRGLPKCVRVAQAGGGAARLAASETSIQRLGSGPSAKSLAANLLAGGASQPLVDRPNIAPGLATTLDFGGTSSKASVTLSHPIIIRKVSKDEGRFTWFRPQLLTVNGSLNVPISRGKTYSSARKGGRTARTSTSFLAPR
jgi:hypothetical protein